MRSSTLTVIVVLAALLTATAVAALVYDKINDDRIAKGVHVGAVDIGGLTVDAARVQLEQGLPSSFERPLKLHYGSQVFTLQPATMKLELGIEASLAQALRRSRQRPFLTRVWTGINGSELTLTIPPQPTYSQAALARYVQHLSHRLDRPAVDASVAYSLQGPTRVPGHAGRRIHQASLQRAIAAQILRPGPATPIDIASSPVQPQLTTSELAQRYPHVIVIDRSNFQLSLYEDLEPAPHAIYKIAIGREGHETPTGLFHIQSKVRDPVWHVPQSRWAGKLAGKTFSAKDPRNPLVGYWMSINGPVGIHGVKYGQGIGRAESHACIRMQKDDVVELAQQVTLGTPVFIG